MTLCVTMLNTMGLDCHTTVFSHALVWTDSRYFLGFESVKVSMQTLQFSRSWRIVKAKQTLRRGLKSKRQEVERQGKQGGKFTERKNRE